MSSSKTLIAVAAVAATAGVSLGLLGQQFLPQGQGASAHANTASASAQTSTAQLGQSLVKLVPAQEVNVRDTVTINGKLALDGSRIHQVSARLSGRVDRIDVVEGSAVMAGQKIALLYSPEFISAQNEFLLARGAVRTLSANATSELLTIPIETALAGLPDVKAFRSLSLFGLSVVTVQFQDGTSPFIARSNMQQYLAGASLPANVSPNLSPDADALGEVMRYRIDAPGWDPTSVKTLQDWVIYKAIKTVPGIADVTGFGGRVKQYQVIPDTGRMQLYGITLTQLMMAVSNGNGNTGGDVMSTGSQRVVVRGLGMIRSLEDMRNVVVAALYPKATMKWLSYLQSSPDLQHQAQHFPKLVTRIYRPYALRSLNCHGRVNLMLQHHEALRLSGLHTLVKASCDSPLVIHTWPVSNDNCVTLQLVSLRDGHREGDLSFQLCWNSEVIFSITFVLRVERRNWQLLITRLQGSQTDSAQEMIKNATKGLHGLRPADLLLQMARHLAGVLKCTEVVMVSNQHRVALNPVRRLKIKFDADKFWMEKGASKRPDGLYVLSPEVEIRSDFSDIPSNKRAQAKRRAEVLRQALDAMSSALNSLNKRRD